MVLNDDSIDNNDENNSDNVNGQGRTHHNHQNKSWCANAKEFQGGPSINNTNFERGNAACERIQP